MKAPWIWSSQSSPNSYCCARGVFSRETPVLRATLKVAADSRYQCWVNGRYLGQGPTPFRLPHVFFDSYDVTERIVAGSNAIAVLGHFIGKPTHTYTVGEPGLVAELEITDADGQVQVFGTGDTWRVKLSEAWEPVMLPRTWATGFVEYFDARREQPGWQQAAFDDRDWEAPALRSAPGIRFCPRITPPLREWFESPAGVRAVAACGTESPQEGKPVTLTEFLDTEPLAPCDAKVCPDGPWTVEASATDGLAVTFDMGVEVVGQIEFELTAAAGTVLEFYGAERLRDGRPWAYLKGGDYACRYTAREGRQAWRVFGYNGLRYLHVVFRKRPGPVVIHRLGVWRREAGLPVTAAFACDDPLWNRLWEVSKRTLLVASQEIQVDCPTREQAVYWGDGVWTALWYFHLTGDIGYLRHMLITAEHVQDSEGMFSGSLFSGLANATSWLYDYALMVPWAMSAYQEHTGDALLPRRLLPVVERLLAWFVKRIGKSGLIELDAAEEQAAARGWLFIDHPGLGWHVQNEPPLERRGWSAGLNLVFLQALRSFSAVGGCPPVDPEALAAAIHRTFWDGGRGVYADAVVEGTLSAQISQQINALAVVTGVCPPDRTRAVLARILDPNDAALCRCTPYFWIHLSHALAKAGMHAEMLEHVAARWKTMLDAGATTWWETFAGDHLDSLCHPWSSVPAHIVLTEILGIKPASPGFATVRVQPLNHLIRSASGTLRLPRGSVHVSWENHGPACVKVEGDIALKLL